MGRGLVASASFDSQTNTPLVKDHDELTFAAQNVAFVVNSISVADDLGTSRVTRIDQRFGIPEPGTLSLLLCAATIALLRRFRHVVRA